jgi:hypothetical protein
MQGSGAELIGDTGEGAAADAGKEAVDVRRVGTGSGASPTGRKSVDSGRGRGQQGPGMRGGGAGAGQQPIRGPLAASKQSGLPLAPLPGRAGCKPRPRLTTQAAPSSEGRGEGEEASGRNRRRERRGA